MVMRRLRALRDVTSGSRAKLKEVTAALREAPELRRLLAANLLSAFSSALLIPTLPLLLMSKGIRLVELGGIFTLIALAPILATRISSRYLGFVDHPRALLALTVLPALLLPGYLYVTDAVGLAALATASGLAGAAAAPGIQARMAASAKPRTRAQLFAWVGAAWSLCYAAGLVLGGLLLGVSYAAVIVTGTTLTLLATLVVSFSLLQETTPELASSNGAVRSGRRLLRDLERSSRRLRVLSPAPASQTRHVRLASAHLFIFGLAVAIYPVYLPLHLQSLGLAPSWIGAAVASSWVTYALAQPLGAKLADLWGSWQTVVTVSLLAASLLNLAIALAPLWACVFAWAALGVADGLGRPLIMAAVADGVDESRRAFAFGWTSTAETAARVAAPLGLALVMARHGISLGFVAVGCIFLASLVPLLAMTHTRVQAPSPSPQGDVA